MERREVLSTLVGGPQGIRRGQARTNNRFLVIGVLFSLFDAVGTKTLCQ